MIQSIKDKINLESIKSSAMKQAGEVGSNMTSQLMSMVGRMAITALAPVLGAISTITRLVGVVKGVVSEVITRTVGVKDQILDPDRGNILDVVPKIPGIVLPSFGGLGSLGAVFTNIATQVTGLGNSALTQINSLFDGIITNKPNDNEPLTPMDSTSDIIQGVPDTNESIITNNQGVLNAKTIKQNLQTPSLETRIDAYNNLSGDTPADSIFIREKLKALAVSSDVYNEVLDSPYMSPVSDVVGLATLGHTIDTPALDPEDWAPEVVLTDRLTHGPAQALPITSKYKVKIPLRNQIQAAYNKLNSKMYVNLYRDRYSYITTPRDYPIARHGTIDKYGLGVATVSHVNMGDYSSIGFAKKINTAAAELSNVVSAVKPEVLPLIDYLYNVNNLNSMTEKPVYQIIIQGTEILVDSRGSRLLLQASRPDDTAIKI